MCRGQSYIVIKRHSWNLFWATEKSHHLPSLPETQTGAGLYSQGGVACAHSPPLVKVDQEHHVISETGQSVGRGHGDDEGKDIINESVKSLQSQTKQ